MLYTKMTMKIYLKSISQQRYSRAVVRQTEWKGNLNEKMVFCWWLRLSSYKHMSHASWVNLIRKIKMLTPSTAFFSDWGSQQDILELQFTLEILSPCGTFIYRHSWIPSTKKVPKSSIIFREWCERKMCLRLLFENLDSVTVLRLIERTC